MQDSPVTFHLLASKPPPTRGGQSAIATSILVHGMIGAALVWGTLAVGRGAEEEEDQVTIIEVVEDVVPPPPPPPPMAEPPPPEVEVPKGFQTLTMPTIVPREIPPPGQEVQEKDFSGEGMEGGRAEGQEVIGPGPGDDVSGVFTFTPYTVKPKCKSGCSAEDILRHVPPLLQRSGISCELTVGIRIDTEGNVTATDILKPSGNAGCDRAADEWARTTKWTTAYNRDQAVTVWIAQPLTITTQ